MYLLSCSPDQHRPVVRNLGVSTSKGVGEFQEEVAKDYRNNYNVGLNDVENDRYVTHNCFVPSRFRTENSHVVLFLCDKFYWNYRVAKS